jgi:proteasome lid subunit RPN8/RPN11
MTLILPGRLCARIKAEARAASPRECCGLIEGVAQAEGFRAIALHPSRNLSILQDQFEIDPAAHIAAARSARAKDHGIIGCYHSHPYGDNEPSARDLAGAAQENFVWLVAAPSGIAAFVYSAGGFTPIGLVTGADLVTSSL